EVLKLLKKTSQTQPIPVVMLTAKGTETDQVVGLELGAADYVSKPFSVKVLLARVRNIFRSSESKKTGGVFTAGEVVLDKERWTVTVKGAPVNLTKLEFRILSFLMENPGKVFSRDQLLSGAWEGEAFVVDRTVDVHVRSIRKKLGKCVSNRSFGCDDFGTRQGARTPT
ncbi:MAG: winged helix-turn-helix domain-containing protein, partial [Candidatus Omnitrophica bacterium]|nr:winged helix-turn-helix domain-containing protein [Candidatus Omnitrophota bacterium]